MKIGIIGAENSHTAAIAKTLNVDKAVPGFEVSHVWGETTDFAKAAAKKGAIQEIVSEQSDMLGKIDAVLVDHRHAKYHLAAVTPFVEAGIPTFVDKPFCIDLDEGIAFVKLAREKGTPITSYSTVPLQKSFLALKEKVKSTGYRTLITAGPVDFESPYGGVYFYLIHQVDMLLNLTTAVPVSARISTKGENGIVSIDFNDGTTGVVQCLKDFKSGFSVSCFADEGVWTEKIVNDDNNYLSGIQTFCKMFETGKEPLKPAGYLRQVAVLEAVQKSYETGKVETVREIPELG